MTNEQLNKYYNKDTNKQLCWVSKDYPCPLKEHCNGLVKPQCHKYIEIEEAHLAIDEMLAWYSTIEEPMFIQFYNSHIAGMEKQRDRLIISTSICTNNK